MAEVETKQRPIEIWAGLIGFAGLASILWVLASLTGDDYDQPDGSVGTVAPATAPRGSDHGPGAVAPQPAAGRQAPTPGH